MQIFMNSSAQLRDAASLLQPQSFLRDTQLLPSVVPLQLKRGFESNLTLRRSGSTSPQIFADTTTRFYYIRRGRTMTTRLQSSERNAQAAPIRTVPVQVANELLKAGHRYLDVRTPEEFAAGHIEGAVNIAYMYKVGTGMAKNLNFLEDVSAQYGKDDEIVVGCQSGKRSQMAATELVAAEFTGVTDMVGGYLAWVQSGISTRSIV